jgi:hypothetical protein
MSAYLQRLPKSFRLSLAATGLLLAAALITVGLTLALTDTFSARGMVFGSFQRCESCPEGRGLHPWAGVQIAFVNDATKRRYVAVTDTKGDYSVSLPVGHYAIGAYYFVGPRDLTVVKDQRTEADFIEW